MVTPFCFDDLTFKVNLLLAQVRVNSCVIRILCLVNYSVFFYFSTRCRNSVHEGTRVLLEVIDHEAPLFFLIQVVVTKKVELWISSDWNLRWDLRHRHDLKVVNRRV